VHNENGFDSFRIALKNGFLGFISMETVRNHVCISDLGGDFRNYVMLHLQFVSGTNAGFSGTLRASSSGFP
jgi:hypothetical protein